MIEDWQVIKISTEHEISAKNRLCKIRRIKVTEFEKVQLSNDKYKIIVRMYPFKENKMKIFIDDSELTRIIKHLNPMGIALDGNYEYISDLISIKVGRSGRYKWFIKDSNDRFIENIGELEIHNYKYDKENQTYVMDSVETFIHLISNASHIRCQKVLFIKKSLFSIVDEILRCGVELDTKTKYISKWTSYYGLQASNSVPVTMPKCVIIPDLYLNIEDIVDIVRQEYKAGYNSESTEPDKYQYKVFQDMLKKVNTCPFDGMGIIDIEMASQWAKDLGLDYVPGSFQIRLCGIKGCLFVMPIKEFINEVSHQEKVLDIDGKSWDYNVDAFNVILTESMFKFKKFYNEKDKAAQWEREFHKEVNGYKRTFNICSYAIKDSDLKDVLLSAYQPLQTMDRLFETDTMDRLQAICDRTVDVIKSMHTDILEFLKYVGIKENGNIRKDSVKPYYRALAVNHALLNDKYVRMKVGQTLENAKEKSYIGKLYLDGNYSVVCSDPYALLQYAFGMEVTGLLGRDKVYSNYWNRKGVETINIWRNPHIFREHWIGQCMKDNRVNKWFRYLRSNIVVSVWDTNLLRCNSADTDGDMLATVKNPILEDEVKQTIDAGKARTIYPDLLCDREDNENIPDVCISDTQAIIESEIRGFSNDIGEVINRISELWGEGQDNTAENYIKILSVVGSLVIDFVKTGVKVPIPKEIDTYIRDNKIKKLRFMMYLPKNRKQRKKEEQAKREFDRECEKNKDHSEDFGSRFSDKDCTMNRIMEYMKSHLEDLEISINVPQFNYTSLIKSRDCNLKKKTQYVKVRDLFKGYVQDQKNISGERKMEEGKGANTKEEYAMIYKAFYDKCQSELLCVCNDKGKLCSKSVILDCCITCAYTEFKEENYSHFDLLWNLFPDELVRRASGKDIIVRSHKDEEKFKKSLDLMREQNNEKFQVLKEVKDNKIACLECDKKIPDDFCIFKSDISEIKSKIPSTVKDYIAARKVYYCYLVAYKRLYSMNKSVCIPCLDNSKQQITNHYISRISGLHNIQVKKAVDTLVDMKIIRFRKFEGHKSCELLFIPHKQDKEQIYYDGKNYLRAFKLMNRYLSR